MYGVCVCVGGQQFVYEKWPKIFVPGQGGPEGEGGQGHGGHTHAKKIS